MENKVNYIQAISFVNLILYTARQRKPKKIWQNPKNGVAILYNVF